MAKSKENQMMINLIGEKNIPKTGDYYQTLMAGIDFVSGMTDNYASHLSRQFSGMAYANYWDMSPDSWVLKRRHLSQPAIDVLATFIISHLSQ